MDGEAADSSRDPGPRLVGLGQVAALLAQYRSAVRHADELAAALAVGGLGGDVLTVTAGVDGRGAPLVRCVLTPAGARRLGALM